MPDWIVMLVGAVVTTLCILFVAVSFSEMRRIGDEAEREQTR